VNVHTVINRVAVCPKTEETVGEHSKLYKQITIVTLYRMAECSAL